MKLGNVHSSILIALLVLPGSVKIFAQSQPLRIRGVVDSFNGQVLVVKSSDGRSASITVPDDLKIRANAKAKLSDIKPGDFVGSAADMGDDGKLHAEEVHIFPESMRGTGEGHRVMEALVDNGGMPEDPGGRTMTNGTVSAASGHGDVTLKIKYKDGEQSIEVAPDTPIVMIVPGDKTLLKTGATVSVVATEKNGLVVATGITAEKDGVKPQ